MRLSLRRMSPGVRTRDVFLNRPFRGYSGNENGPSSDLLVGRARHALEPFSERDASGGSRTRPSRLAHCAGWTLLALFGGVDGCDGPLWFRRPFSFLRAGTKVRGGALGLLGHDRDMVWELSPGLPIPASRMVPHALRLPDLSLPLVFAADSRHAYERAMA